MTINRTAVDHTALPDALLPMVKEHCRVRHDRDDQLITSYIASAVGLIERQCNVSLDPATYTCTGDELRRRGPLQGLGRWRIPATPATATSYALPMNNVRTAVVTDAGEPPVDHSTEYELWNPDFGGNGASYLVQQVPSTEALCPNWLVELEVGILKPEDLAPAVSILIARMTASLYENREASSALWADTWAAELTALWRPEA